MNNEHRRIKPFVPKARTNVNTISNNYTAPRGSGLAPAQPAVNRLINDQNTAMDLSVMNARPRGPLTPELRQYRMNNKLCLYAGCTGHFAKDWPLLRTANERKTSLRSTNFNPTTPAAPVAPAPLGTLQITAVRTGIDMRSIWVY